MKETGVFALLLLVAACGGDRLRVETEPMQWPVHMSPLPPAYVLGQQAPDIHLPVVTKAGIGPDSVHLSDFRGEIVVLNFWNTGCGPCVAEHQTLSRIAGRFRQKGVRYFGIDFGDTQQSLRAFEDQHEPSSYPQLWDAADETGKAFHRSGWPLHVVIDQRGRVAWWRPGGPIQEKTMDEVLGAVLDGRRPTSPTNAAYPDNGGA
jgi:peroxiredoxin